MQSKYPLIHQNSTMQSHWRFPLLRWKNLAEECRESCSSPGLSSLKGTCHRFFSLKYIVPAAPCVFKFWKNWGSPSVNKTLLFISSFLRRIERVYWDCWLTEKDHILSLGHNGAWMYWEIVCDMRVSIIFMMKVFSLLSQCQFGFLLNTLLFYLWPWCPEGHCVMTTQKKICLHRDIYTHQQ